MAATDKPYRNQYALDVVFALSSILMLISIVWMFVQDYNREFKEEQRRFRDIETAMAQRAALDSIPSTDELKEAEKRVEEARSQHEKQKDKRDEAQRKLDQLRPEKDRAEADFQGIKAELESVSSFYNIGIEKYGTREHPEVERYYKRLHELETQVVAAQAIRDDKMALMKKQRTVMDEIDRPLTEATAKLKKLNDRFDTQVKLAVTKQWGFGDWLRTQPVIDAFASPVKIQQVTNNDIPIDYNFKQVTRFDRCATCHLGMERPSYTKANLLALTKDPSDAERKKVDSARAILQDRRKTLEGLSEARTVPDPNSLRLSTVPASQLTEARINEYCAHPRLDLFVGPNSKHPAEKFGCSSCHAGQGSSTSFFWASHTPNTPAQKERWTKEHDWESIHDWDFPMLPQRFIESSCVKCHHEMTDLVSSENRVEAPKLMRGYNLLKENGCFGCHEIAGTKRGEKIAPDVRLEPIPPLEDLSPAERAKRESDAENPPGRMRKVGPSLYRLSEKTNKDWTARWIRAPREFRPDTKMPHFYGNSNNDEKVLPDSQKKFPNTEIWAITDFLFNASNEYLGMLGDEKTPKEELKRHAALTAKKADTPLTREEKQELSRLETRKASWARAGKDTKLTDVAAGYQGNAEMGRVLFTERGCLACHVHEGTGKTSGTPGKPDYSPAVHGEAVFGPNLSQLAAKIGNGKSKDSARTWLVQWIMDPHQYSPRSRMPVTHLDAKQAADVAAWLISQPASDLGSGWNDLQVDQPRYEDLLNLARVYLVRIMAKEDMENFLAGKKVDDTVLTDLPVEEQELADNFNEGGLRHYLGKKAVSRLGCYACHDIPGFDNAKPIGVGLNDWGKKDASRLAFEDIENFWRKHYYVVDSLVDKDGKPQPFKQEGGDVKRPYERFFAEKLEHHHQDRTGFLHQKLLDPRSYDYERLRPWDDRYRMPQFRFARARRKADETSEQYEARAWVEEAEAREAVMTFILGLTAEMVPARSVNQPKGDRLAEVKGRQILDKYNCGGCHLIRAGVYDFNLSPDSFKALERAHTSWESKLTRGDYDFPEHRAWSGNLPTADRLLARGARAFFIKTKDDEDNELKKVMIRLSDALTYLPREGPPRNIANSVVVILPLEDVVADSARIDSQADLDRALNGKGPYGGTLSELLRFYLAQKDPVLYKLEGGVPGFDETADSGNGRAALPPSLLGQGERTQPDWLYQFLLNPEKVRRMTILRMPRFNMSKDEARALVDYFAAVERITNPGIGLDYPQEVIDQQGELAESTYWAEKNKEYVGRLKGSLKERLASNKSAWEQIEQEQGPTLKKALEKAREDVTARTKERKEKQKQVDAEKDAAKRKTLQEDLDKVAGAAAAAEAQVQGLTGRLEMLSVAAQQKAWEKSEAYASDAWRLIMNRQLCLQCHQIGEQIASNQQTSGPPLALAHQRLRPEWTKRWIATPEHFGPYTAPPMPPYFPRDKVQYQHLFVGDAREQVIAVRDALMNYPHVSALPLNRLWRPEQGEEKK